jgi:hypothetical protein
MRLEFTLFGIATIPRCQSQRNTTPAGVVPSLVASAWIVGWLRSEPCRTTVQLRMQSGREKPREM